VQQGTESGSEGASRERVHPDSTDRRSLLDRHTIDLDSGAKMAAEMAGEVA